jgi:hypothetical protein
MIEVIDADRTDEMIEKVKYESSLKHAQCDRVRISIIQQAGEGREVHAIRNEVQGLHSGNRPPLIGQESRIDPRRNRRDACGLAINSDFHFTKISIATAEQIVNGTELIRQAGEPLLISRLFEARQSSLHNLARSAESLIAPSASECEGKND